MGMPIRDSVWTVRDRATKQVMRIEGIVVHGESTDVRKMAENDYYLSALYRKAYTKETRRERRAKNRLVILRIELSSAIAGYTTYNEEKE